jgi:hypothetical protein
VNVTEDVFVFAVGVESAGSRGWWVVLYQHYSPRVVVLRKAFHSMWRTLLRILVRRQRAVRILHRRMWFFLKAAVGIELIAGGVMVLAYSEDTFAVVVEICEQ